MKTVSLCMIVKNEEAVLGRCLDSIKDCIDEIIIVDTGSTDETISVAKKYGARVYEHPWNNSFSEARNYSLGYATCDWILIMDADDEFCKEDKEKFMQLKEEDYPDASILYFQTLNYCGATADVMNITVNPNPRLFKNHQEFCYEGIVHNQLVNPKNEIQHIFKSIRIYHYGYLDSYVKEKDKRKRNKELLLKQIEEDPQDRFAYFNLGNEYSSLGDMEKALENYQKSYEEFHPNSGYGYYLLIKMVSIHFALKHIISAYDLTLKGINYYPGSSDFYYYHGIINKYLGRITTAERSLKKCLELGEENGTHKFLYGTGSFKAAYELAEIYQQQKDYEEAFHYYNEALRMQGTFQFAVYGMARVMKLKQASQEEFKELLNTIYSDVQPPLFILANISYLEEYYEVAIEYLDQYETLNGSLGNAVLLRKLIFMKQGKFKTAASLKIQDKKEEYYLKDKFLQIICNIIEQKEMQAQKLLIRIEKNKLTEFEKKQFQVYKQFLRLCKNEPTEILSDEKEETGYTDFIFEILDILLASRQEEIYLKSLALLNTISDESVLLRLGKLYFKYGYEEQGKQELIHSISEFSRYDEEALDLLKVT